MKLLFTLSLVLVVGAAAQDARTTQPTAHVFDAAAADRFAKLALACVHQEYPNKIAHLMNSDADLAPPRKLTPAFYGCYDWHSSVHGHWLLARLARTFPEASFTPAAREALKQSITPENIAAEARYLRAPGRENFERPYGLAWLLTLGQELREWNDPLAQQLSRTLEPLEQAAKERLATWLPKLSHPVRIGEHNQTAFALALMLDAARQSGDTQFASLIETKARAFYGNDKACPLSYEPSGEDFLSPCLAEADLMRRVMKPSEFASWLTAFLPGIPGWPAGGTSGDPRRMPWLNWLKPVVSPDRSDPKLAHLDGLNLSRAWMLEGIASALGNDPRAQTLRWAANEHREAGLAAVTGQYYVGGHWLGSFAVYLVTKRGMDDPGASAHR